MTIEVNSCTTYMSNKTAISLEKSLSTSEALGIILGVGLCAVAMASAFNYIRKRVYGDTVSYGVITTCFYVE